MTASAVSLSDARDRVLSVVNQNVGEHAPDLDVVRTLLHSTDWLVCHFKSQVKSICLLLLTAHEWLALETYRVVPTILVQQIQKYDQH